MASVVSEESGESEGGSGHDALGGGSSAIAQMLEAVGSEDEDEEKVVEKSPKGRFHRFNRKLGSGAFKTVYLAFDNDTGREVAWNVISFARLKRNERKRIDEEIQIAKSLDHPRIMRFINAWINKEKSEVVFITERVSGGSLRQYINRLDGPLKLKIIRNWCRQILEGVVYLHTQPAPIIRRDLKLQNLFINGNDGKVLIGDLGLSTALKASSCATSIVGTPEFMAPELYEEKYGTSVDIYAFGMCLLEMVSREFPYAECATAGAIYKKVISGEPPRVLFRVKDPELRALIARCIDSNPDNRPTAQELLEDPYWAITDDGDNLAELTPVEEAVPLSSTSPIPPPAVAAAPAAAAAGGPLTRTSLSGTVSGASRSVGRSRSEEKFQPATPAGAALSSLGGALGVGAAGGGLPGVFLAGNNLAIPKSQTIASPSRSPRPADLLSEGLAPLGTLTLVEESGRGPLDAAMTSTAASVLQGTRPSGRGAPSTAIGSGSPLSAASLATGPMLGSSAAGRTRFGEAEEAEFVAECRRCSVLHLDAVQMVVEVTPGVFHGVRFDFNVQSDSVTSVARELRDAGLVWQGVSDSDLLDMLLDALKLRLKRRSSETPVGSFLLPTSESTTTTTSATSANPSRSLPVPPAIRQEAAAAAVAAGAVAGGSGGVVSGGGGGHGEEELEKMLQLLGVESVREFQSKNGLEESGFADERTWRLVVEQYEVKRRKEEEKIQKREEAKLKAKQENERKLLLQQQESAKALDVILEKALTDIAGASASASAVSAPPVQTETLTSGSPLSPAAAAGIGGLSRQPPVGVEGKLSPTISPSAPPVTTTAAAASTPNLLADQLL